MNSKKRFFNGLVMVILCVTLLIPSFGMHSVAADVGKEASSVIMSDFLAPDSGYTTSVEYSHLVTHTRTGNHYVAQGGCTDGTYAYIAINDNYDANQSWSSDRDVIYKIRLSDGAICKISDSLDIHHANGMAYNPKTGQIAVAQCAAKNGDGGAPYRISFVDANSLCVIGSRQLSVAVSGIAYNATNRCYVGGKGFSFYIFDENFNVKKTLRSSAATESSQNYTVQDIDCDDKYIYAIRSHNSVADNHIVVYDWNGKFKRYITMGVQLEGESIFHSGSAFYMSFYNKARGASGRGNGVQIYKAQFRTVPKITYSAHVQNVGWQGAVANASVSGTTGKSLRVEALKLSFANTALGGLTYRTHVQNIGWQGWVSNGAVAGTTGRGLRVEAFQVKLTGEAASLYNVYYRAHVQDIGWTGWVSNGATAGTSGRSLRVEAFQIKLLPKAWVGYSAHVQNVGWQASVTSEGKIAGTQGESKRIEALKIWLSGISGVNYRSYVQGSGWQDMKANGAVSGTTGKALQLEGIQISLTGNAAAKYNVYYRVHVQNIGWMDWVSNGATAGAPGKGFRVEAIQIEVIRK